MKQNHGTKAEVPKLIVLEFGHWYGWEGDC